MKPRKALAAALTSAIAFAAATLAAVPAAHAGYPFPYTCTTVYDSADIPFDGGTTFYPGNAYCVGSSYELVMQPDGNLVEYNRTGRAVWSTGTNYNDDAAATFQTDGNLVVYPPNSSYALWSSNSWGHYGSTFWLQQDGNLVIYASYHGGGVVWASGTNGR